MQNYSQEIICLNCKISIVFSLAVSMVEAVSLYVPVMISIMFNLIMKGNAMSITTMIKSVIVGVLVLVGQLALAAPTMIRYCD